MKGRQVRPWLEDSKAPRHPAEFPLEGAQSPSHTAKTKFSITSPATELLQGVTAPEELQTVRKNLRYSALWDGTQGSQGPPTKQTRTWPQMMPYITVKDPTLLLTPWVTSWLPYSYQFSRFSLTFSNMQEIFQLLCTKSLSTTPHALNQY